MNTWLLLLCSIALAAGVVRGENRPPQWEETLREALHTTGIREDVSPGSPIGVLRATDADGDGVTYTTDSDYFNVEASTGKVTLALALDRETNAEVSVTFRATDSKSSPIQVTYTVKLLDVNDNSPVFSNVPYSAVVAENDPVGAEVFTGISVTDKDSGVNAVIQLSCHVPNEDPEARAACDTFKVNQRHVSEGVYTGSLALRHSVQYKTKSKYILTLRAMDQGRTPRQTIVNVVIEVRDIQDDPPEFLYTPLSLVIYENVDIGSSVGELNARDQDVGSPNPLQLTIVSDPRGLFSLGDSTEGSDGVVTTAIKVNGQIDREQIGSNYEFTVQAVEIVGGQPSTSSDHKVNATVKVLVRDKNDQSPTFNKQVYDITIDEELARGRSLPDLDIIVTDNDLVENAYFELRILNDARNIFALSPTNGSRSAAVSVVVMEPRFLDYEQPQYRTRVIELLAIETQTTEQHSTRATVNIHLRDINDHSPRFTQTSYTTSVMENRPVTHHIRTITATDDDSGSFGKVTYSLVGTLSEKFNVNSNTGVITLAEKLDYESEKVISLMFTATDGGGRSNSVPFKVNVLDFNDQGPVFDADHYQTFVDESSTQMSPNVTIHAVDVDSDRDVTYRIQSGNTIDNAFAINSKTGFFTLRRTVDYRETLNNQGFFPVIVEASDNDRPPVTATTTVVVTVRDENNHAPVFNNTIYRRTVTELTPPDTSVVQVKATDMDFDNNAKIGYVLYSGGRDNFIIDYYTGLVQVAPRANLDIERFGQQYTMIAYAIDNGSPQRTGTAQVIITVTDSNNKLPTYPQDLYRLFVLETAPPGTLIEALKANDPDTGARLEYHIKSNSITAKDKNGNPVIPTSPFNYKTAFTVGPTSGAIKTHSVLNQDQVAEVTFIVRATDKNAEHPPVQIGSATVIITIRRDAEGDIAFQKPWSANNPKFYVPVFEEESTEPPNMILRLVATDPRTGQQLRHFREVENSDPNNYFTVNPDTGEIYINRRLDYETMQNKQIRFHVETYSDDTGPGRRSAIATVIVDVVDINDNSPHFQSDAYEFTVRESSKSPTWLGTVKAKDDDSGSYGNVTYSLSGQGADIFNINPFTGLVTVAPNVTLDHETDPQYLLTVMATDNVNGPGINKSTSVSLMIHVKDENDNSPSFEQSHYRASAMETLGREMSIVRVHAIDRDTGSNGHIVYRVVGGGEGLFYIKNGMDVIVTKKPLNGHARETPYVLTVEARDSGVPPLTSTTKVTIFVNTMQSSEGKPRFEFPPEDGYYINVTEDGDVGTNVTTIRAHDGVSGSPGNLRYYFYSGNKKVQDVGPFHIDENTGQITTTEKVDHEKQPLYKLTIMVEGQGNPPKMTIRHIFVKLQDVDDNLPSFKTCPPSSAVSDPLETHVREEKEPKVLVVKVTACDIDNHPYNIIEYVITCGNVDPKNIDIAPFWINSTSGEIWTQVKLDRETKDRYSLCVEARNSTEPGSRRKRDVNNDQMITVNVIVDDLDDSKPSFAETGASGSRVTAGVLASAPLGSRVVRVYAVDHDQPKNAANKYALSDIFFIKSGSDDKNLPDAFYVDKLSGVVRTNQSYFDFVDGYFSMKVIVTDSDGKHPNEAKLVIHVVRSNQRLRFIFNKNPETMQRPEQGPAFISDVDNKLSDVKIYADGLHYHVENDANVDFSKTDMCFHVVKDNQVVNPDAALRMFQDVRSDENWMQLYRNYSVAGVGLCEVKVTTRWWSGYWFLWWILIAFALFILIVCLILICCICCPCCYCFSPKEHPPHKYRPSIILEPVPQDTVSAPIVVTSTARTVPNDDFEWQENIVTMD